MNPADILSLCVVKTPDGKYSFRATSVWKPKPWEYGKAITGPGFALKKSDLPVEQWAQIKSVVETTKPDAGKDGTKCWILVYGLVYEETRCTWTWRETGQAVWVDELGFPTRENTSVRYEGKGLLTNFDGKEGWQPIEF